LTQLLIFRRTPRSSGFEDRFFVNLAESGVCVEQPRAGEVGLSDNKDRTG
jgi:hypothetical protein